MVTKMVLKLTVVAQEVTAENIISVGRCVIPLSKGFVPHCSVIRVGIKTKVYFGNTCIPFGTESKDQRWFQNNP